MKTTLQVRVDPVTKNKARKIFESLGLDTSSAINLYLKQVINSQSIPFRIVTENGFTPQREAEILRETKEALKSGKAYSSVDEMFRDILK